MSKETRALVSANSKVALLFEVSRPNGEQFLTPDKELATSTLIRTMSAVAAFIGCSERTVRRALTSQKNVEDGKSSDAKHCF